MRKNVIIQKQKMVKYGDYYHLTIPSLPIVIGERISKYFGEKIEKTPQQLQELNYLYSLRTKKRLKDIILSNIHIGIPKFLTLTYRTPEFDELKVKNDFKNFIKRLRYHTGVYMRYIAVLEKHDSIYTDNTRRYSYHIHVVIMDMNYLSASIYSDIWRNGFIKINRIKGDNVRMANYICKYLTKTDEHNKHKRRYLNSKNCLKPLRVDFQDLPLLEFVNSRRYNRFTGGTCLVEIYKAKYA